MNRPDKCEPMDRERFTEAFVAILDASERPLPPDIVEDPIHIDNGDGSLTTVHFTDHPLGRVIIAAREYFASNDDDDQEHLNFLYRFGGLHALIGYGVLSEWVPTNADGQAYEVHVAVLHAAAEVPMTKKGRFPRQVFIRKVQQIIDEDWRLPEFSEPKEGAEGTP